MWVGSSYCTEESKRLVGNFLGNSQCKWGTSSASYAQSIGMLTGVAWEEIEDGALEFTKHGRRFKATSPVIKEDACAHIIDCDSNEDSADSLIGDQQLEHAEDQQTRDYDEDVPLVGINKLYVLMSLCSCLTVSRLVSMPTVCTQYLLFMLQQPGYVSSLILLSRVSPLVLPTSVYIFRTYLV